MMRDVSGPPLLLRAAPTGARVTCAVTSGPDRGRVAEPRLTFEQVSQTTSTLDRSSTLLKLMVRIGLGGVTFVKLTVGEPVVETPLIFVTTAEHAEISNPIGME